MRISNFLIIILVLIFLIQSISALENYSVSMFGTGMATGNAISTNYNSIFLSEAKATTRGADSDSYTVNVGFFEDTLYYRTVSITSYSISPKTVVIGSTISLFISALNAQAVWARITAPNGQQQTINLVNNEFITYTPPSIVGRYNITLYANSTTGAIASIIDYFELTEEVILPPTPTSRPEPCTYIWGCTPWSLCEDGFQTRECENLGTCIGDEGKPIEIRECIGLFDVFLKLEKLVLTKNQTIRFNVDLIEMIGLEKIDVFIKYSIIKDNQEIFSQIETRAVQGNLSYIKELEDLVLSEGNYILRIDIIYEDMQRAFAEQGFIVEDEEIKLIPDVPPKPDLKILVIIFLILIILIVILIIILIIIKILRKRSIVDILVEEGNKEIEKGYLEDAKRVYNFLKELYESKYKGDFSVYNKIKNYYNTLVGSMENKSWLFILPFLVFIAIVFVGYNNITCLAIGDLTSLDKITGLWMILICILGLSIFIYRKSIKEIIKRIKKGKKFSINSINGLVNKKVYTNSGDYLGKIAEVILSKNKIISFKIKIDRKYKLKSKGIVVKWKEIVSCREIIIINKNVLKNVRSLKA